MSALGEKRSAKPSDHEQHLRDEVEHGHREAERVEPRAPQQPDAAMTATTTQAAITSPGCRAIESMPSASPR